MVKLHRTNLFPQLDVIKQFGGEWFKRFIQTSISGYSESHESLKIDFFKDGKSYNFNVETFKNSTDPALLPCSVRLTNIQLVVPEVFRMCLELEKKYKRPFTCNLYYTPGPERNCFDFHVDHQLTYVCQILGSKNWLFPLENNEYLTHLHETNFSVEQVRDKVMKQELLNPGDHLMVPYAVVHKVEIQGDSPSLHFTFGSYEHTREKLIQNFLSLALSESGLNQEIKKDLSHEEMRELMTKLKAAINELSTEDFLKEYEGKIKAEELRVMKQGRLYKKDPSTNQD